MEMIMRKTLWQRLDPQIKQQLENNEAVYPQVVNKITDELKDKKFWSDLTLNTVNDLITFSGSDLFSIKSSDLIFGTSFLCED